MGGYFLVTVIQCWILNIQIAKWTWTIAEKNNTMFLFSFRALNHWFTAEHSVARVLDFNLFTSCLHFHFLISLLK